MSYLTNLPFLSSEHREANQVGVSRRLVLSLLIKFPLLAACLEFLPPVFADTTEGSAAGSISSDIAENIQGDLRGQLVGIAFGSILSAAGVDVSGMDQINGKLDTILTDLTVLQQSVDQLASEMQEMLIQSRWDAVAMSAQSLIRQNNQMMKWYKAIVRHGASSGEIATAKDQLRGLIRDYDLDSAVDQWNDLMCGSLHTDGIISVWGKSVYLRCKGFYGPLAAHWNQRNWDRFDAEQAHTWLFLFEKYRDNPQLKSFLPERMDTWRKYRKRQLALLRGMERPTDKSFSYVGSDNKKTSENVAINFLPQNVGIDMKNLRMWRLIVNHSWPRRDYMVDFDNDIRKMLNDESQLKDCTSDGRCPGWWVPTVNEFVDLIYAVGGSQSPDTFYQAMRQAGFKFDNRPGDWNANDMNIWTSNSQNVKIDCSNPFGCKTDLRILMHEGGTSRYAERAGWNAMLLFRRNISPQEAQRYWYPTF
jgi:hypothetical protein